MTIVLGESANEIRKEKNKILITEGSKIITTFGEYNCQSGIYKRYIYRQIYRYTDIDIQIQIYRYRQISIYLLETLLGMKRNLNIH